jgi:hypothetical protein
MRLMIADDLWQLLEPSSSGVNRGTRAMDLFPLRPGAKRPWLLAAAPLGLNPIPAPPGGQRPSVLLTLRVKRFFSRSEKSTLGAGSGISIKW